MNRSLRKRKTRNQKTLRRSISYIPEIFVWKESLTSFFEFHLKIPVFKFSSEFAYLRRQEIKSHTIGTKYLISSNSCCLLSVFDTLYFNQKLIFAFIFLY